MALNNIDVVRFWSVGLQTTQLRRIQTSSTDPHQKDLMIIQTTCHIVHIQIVNFLPFNINMLHTVLLWFIRS